MKQEQNTFAHTIAYRNPTLANKFCIEAGLGPCRTPDEIAYKLNRYIAQHGDPAVEALKEIHPDYELFKVEAPAPVMNQAAAQNRNMNACGSYHNCCGMSANGYSNCSGCGGACQNRYMNASGNESNKVRPMGMVDSNQLITIAGIFSITALLIYAMSTMAARKG